MDIILWVFLALVLIALAAYYYWQRQINVPLLTHILFPPYDVPDVILVGGLLVENRGRASALNVKIDIQYDQGDKARIQHMHVTSDDPYVLRGGGEQHNFANIRLRALGPQKRLFVFWAAGEQFQPTISVTCLQPSGKQIMFRPGGWSSFFRRGRKT